MTGSRSSSRLRVIIASASAVLIAGVLTSFPASARRPRARSQPIGASELLRSEPFDRLTLIDNTVLIIEPVSPRPLPVIDPRKERERRKQGGQQDAATLPIEVGGAERRRPTRTRRRTREGLDVVKIHLIQGGRNEVRDFQVKRSSLKKIEYFEDLLLDEVDRLIMAREFARAFECCLRVSRETRRGRAWTIASTECCSPRGGGPWWTATTSAGSDCFASSWAASAIIPGLLDQIAEAYGKRIERAAPDGPVRAGPPRPPRAGGSDRRAAPPCAP